LAGALLNVIVAVNIFSARKNKTPGKFDTIRNLAIFICILNLVGIIAAGAQGNFLGFLLLIIIIVQCPQIKNLAVEREEALRRANMNPGNNA